MTEFAALVWSPDEIRVLSDNGGFRWKQAIAPEDRYSLRLQSDYAGRLYLRAVQNRQPFMISIDKGATFEPVSPIPGEGAPVSAFGCKLHPARGVITVLDNKILWVYDVAARQWNIQNLPFDIHVHDVSFDGQGGLWCAGSSDLRRIPGEETEAAVRYKAARGGVFQPRSPRLNPITAAKVIKQGGLAELRTINADSEPVVATSNCSWILEDNSSFVFIFTSDVTHVKRLKGELISHIDRPGPGMVRVFTYAGSRWEDTGTGLNQYVMAPAIVKALGTPNRRILIRGMDTRLEKIIAAVEIAPPGADDIAQDPEFTAVCISTDGGKSFRVLYRISFKNGEIQDVAWLN